MRSAVSPVARKPDWLHSLEKQIAAGQLAVEEAVLMVIDFNSDLDDAQP
jgi:hypothetical protein